MTLEDLCCEEVHATRRGAVAWITLNRPEAMNSISPRLLSGLDAALDAVQQDRSLRCVVLTGAGRGFCAGADLKAVKAQSRDADQAAAARAFRDKANAVVGRIEQFPLPVIAAVNGLALAGGLELVLVCDMVIAAQEAKFGDAHARLGLLPGWGASARLPRKIGINRAKQMMLTAQQVPAAVAEQWGLVNQVVPLVELESAATALCDSLVDKSPLGLRRMKQLLNDALDQPLEIALRAEGAMNEAHNASSDRAEGLAAFAEKRTPCFTGA